MITKPPPKFHEPRDILEARGCRLEAVGSGGFPHDPAGNLLHLLDRQHRLVTARGGGLPKQPSDQRRRRDLFLGRPPLQRKVELANALRTEVWPLIEQGIVKPVLHASFALADAPKAHALMESSQHIGKIVLRVR